MTVTSPDQTTSDPSSAPEKSVPEVPRAEHPRPQFVRDTWLTLNGTWQFEADRADSGLERGLVDSELSQQITVPFAPESQASGIADTDFLNAVWYRREISAPADWEGRRVVLHFGAVDHDATVWVNGVEVARHRGGFTPFSADITEQVPPGGTGVVVVRARDDQRSPQARGKQSTRYANYECLYTRTTGIWQTVWLEGVPVDAVESIHVVSQLDPACFDVSVAVRQTRRGLRVRASLSDEKGQVASAELGADQAQSSMLRLEIAPDRARPWGVTDPHLYDLVIDLLDGDDVIDTVRSYAGLRTVSVVGNSVLINGDRVFQRLVLDQGYWPDSLMTAPSDQALIDDITLAQQAGFNGARLHQKVFEERFLFHADRLGYLVWGEFGDWGASDQQRHPSDHQQQTASFITQWVETVVRDRNHPAVVGWCPLNETWQAIGDRITQLDDVTHGMYLATKAADRTRPVLDTSGYSHRVRGADIYDSHNYEQDPAEFAAQVGGLAQGRPYVNDHDGRALSLPHTGQPYFVSEYGGIWWNQARADEAQDPDRLDSWGYGQRVRNLDEWYARFAGLTDVLLDDPDMFGYCYTQLTDTFQEENGIYDFWRRPKFDNERLHQIQSRQAAYEERTD